MTAGIDSQILIYAEMIPNKPRGKLPPERRQHLKELRWRSKSLLKFLEEEIVVLPMVCVAEVLVPVPASRRGMIIGALTKRFNCRPLNLQAASFAADLWAGYESEQPEHEEDQYDDRHVLRADTLIIGTLKAAGVSTFYSHDRKCRTLAKRVLTHVLDIPKRDPKGNLFEKLEAAEDEDEDEG